MSGDDWADWPDAMARKVLEGDLLERERLRQEAVRRNPILGLVAIRRLQARPADERAEIREILLELRASANVAAENAWTKRKGPMAAYWRAVATYAGHTARALR